MAMTGMKTIQKIWTTLTMVIGILMGLFPLLHVWEMHRVESSQGQSFPAVVFWEIGIVIWLIYGLLKNDKVIFVSNCIGVCAGLLYLATIIKYS